MPERERYTLTVEALPDPAPAVVRLRRVVKALLRHYGFKLLAAVEEARGEDAPTETIDPKRTTPA